MDEAVGLAPDPQLHVDPGRIGLTGLDSYFSVRPPRPIQVSATVPGFTVTAEARPVQYAWDFGDGATRTTHGPGRPWSRRRPGSIAHLYETHGVYSIGVEIVWAARWRIGTGEWRHLGYFSTADARDYPVRQIVALLVKPR